MARPWVVQTVLFHPIRPYLFVATQRHVRIYNLTKQELTKKLMTGSKWISSLAVHPGGDNVLVGTFDKRVQWFDLDLSTSPYQVPLGGQFVMEIQFNLLMLQSRNALRFVPLLQKLKTQEQKTSPEKKNLR